MIDDFNKITSYISDDIESVYDELKNIDEEVGRLQSFLNNMKEYNSDYDYSEDLFKKIDANCSYQKFCHTLFILDRLGNVRLESEPQYNEMVRYIESLENKLFLRIDSLSEKYNQLINNFQKRKREYEELKHFLDDLTIDVNNDEFMETLSKFHINDTLRNMVINYIKNRHAFQEETSKDSEHVISKLDGVVVQKIKDYLREFYKLSLTEKNSIISANDLINEGDYENLMHVVYGFNQDEIIYYVTIYNLLDYFNEYIDLIKDNDNNASLVDIMEKINGCLEKLSKIEQLFKEKEKEEEQEDNSEVKNIVLFLDINGIKDGNVITTPVTEIDLKYIQNKKDGEEDKDIKNIVRMLISRFRSMDGEKFKQLGHNANKMIVNYENKIFKELNVWCSKGRKNNPIRIPYSIVGVSENNKKEIIERYHLPENANIYLVYGLFTKKNNDSEYVRITSNRLVTEYDAIKFLLSLFQNDFDELSRVRAFKMIDNSLELLNDMESEYQNENVR